MKKKFSRLIVLALVLSMIGTMVLPAFKGVAYAETGAEEGDGQRPAKPPEGGGGPGGPGGNTSDIVATDAAGPQITAEPEATDYVIEGSGYAAPVYSVTAKLPEDSTAKTISYTWYVEGTAKDPITVEAAPNVETVCTYTASDLMERSYGVYPVYCVVSCVVVSGTEESGTKTETVHSNTSLTANFIVCRGVQADSFLTFSDVHECFSNIGTAISNIMGTDGLIPALIICTGDWSNDHYTGGDSESDNYAVTMNTAIRRLKAQSGGIDTVFVAGNHDNTAAAVDASKAANLGATSDLDDGAGIVFDSSTADRNGRSSKDADDLIVYGINFESVLTDSNGHSYEKVIADLDQYLNGLRENYAGQLVVISSHTGLHVLDKWGGESEYNVDKSDEMVELLNKYAASGMNILFLFGHDHSKGESEFFCTPGDTISSTVSYADRSEKENTLQFAYGHAGYITKNAGGNQRYTEVAWTDLIHGETGRITRVMSDISGATIAESQIAGKAAGDSQDTGAAYFFYNQGQKTPEASDDVAVSPKTGEENMTLFATCIHSIVSLLEAIM